MDLATATANRDVARTAYQRALLASSHSRPGGSSVQRQEIEALKRQLDYWERAVRRLSDSTDSTGTAVAEWVD